MIMKELVEQAEALIKALEERRAKLEEACVTRNVLTVAVGAARTCAGLLRKHSEYLARAEMANAEKPKAEKRKAE